MKSWIGIDPGKSGGLVELSRNRICMIPMPQTEKDIWEWFSGTLDGAKAIIEWIHPAIQGIGKSPMSKLYGNYMSLRMCLTAAEIPFEDVKPHAWQKYWQIPKRKKAETRTQWKNRLKAKSQQVFPKEKITLATCDALLIAEFCRRKSEGLL